MTTHSAVVPKRLREREILHRRLLLASASTLLVLTTAPIFAHHLPIPLSPSPQHFFGFCVAAATQLLSPVHHAFHIVLAVGLVYASYDRIKAATTLRSVLAQVETEPIKEGGALWSAAVRGGLEPSNVRSVRGLPNPVFAAGAFRPRIYVASDLADRLASDELTLVFAHEAAHINRRDPLRLSVYRFLSCTFFWIPALRRLSDDIADEAEIEADDAASGAKPLILASALLRLASGGKSLPATVGFGSRDLLDRRVRRLAGEETSLPSRLTWRSIIGTSFAIALVFTSGVAVELRSGAPHCMHDHQFPLTHIFCAEATWHRSETPCPHSGGSRV